MKQQITVRNVSNSTIIQSRGVSQIGKYLVDKSERRVYIGNTYVEFHPKMKGDAIVVLGDHIIIDRYKLVDKEWVNLHTMNRPWNKIKNWFKARKEKKSCK